MKRYLLLLGLFLLVGSSLFAQKQKERVVLDWSPAYAYPGGGDTLWVLSFRGSSFWDKYGALPVWHQIYSLDAAYEGYAVKVELRDMIFEALPENESAAMDLERLTDEVVVSSFQKPYGGDLSVYVVPLRKNHLTGSWERLVSFTTVLVKEGPAARPVVKGKNFVEHSRLATGDWYKIYVTEDGMYQLSVADLASLGLPVSSLDPSTLKIYGNGGGMLPESNSDVRLDDLNEIAIHVSGAEDGRFDGNDKITFYGESPDEWIYYPIAKKFKKEVNFYARRNCYYVTYGGEAGKRITTRPSSTATPTNVVTTVDFYKNHELDEISLDRSGREWYGEAMDVQTSITIPFEVPDIVIGSEVYLFGKFAARSLSPSRFFVTVQGETFSALVKSVGDTYGSAFARAGSLRRRYPVVNSNLEVKVEYEKPTSISKGWIDQITVSGRRALVFHGGQMSFCDRESVYYGNVAEFVISQAGERMNVYDVSDHQNVALLEVTRGDQEARFVADASELHNYLAIDGGYLKPELGAKVANQDLHAHQPVNMVILTHPDFMTQAEELARFHQEEGLSVRVVTPFEIYNEFSCGTQDITAIRDYLRMLYERGEGDSGLRFLLLFGDASYDYLDRIPNNENFIPAWQSPNSLGGGDSYVTDDFYGVLDAWEGGKQDEKDDDLDIGIGRLVVSNTEEAEMAIHKIMAYASSSQEMKGKWRNNITIIADDEDKNIHIYDADDHARYLDTLAPAYNVNKVYLDAYPQMIASGGARYPDANQAINASVAKGNLIVNYVGHGGKLGWSLERVVEIADINSWKNYDKMSLFITATCEFARYDDPAMVSAGELVFMNPHGGGVALMTTTRITYASSNYALNHYIYAATFKKEQGEYPTLGAIMRTAKNRTGSSSNAKRFILIGDPAMRLAYPQRNVETTQFNGKPMSDQDTIKALDFVTISGRVCDENGQTDTSFDGVVYPTVFDKPAVITTLSNDPTSFPFEFTQQNKILYSGQAEVKGGAFSFSFRVPKDINYSYGHGKISYYVTDGVIDGQGCDEHFLVGGYSHEIQSDVSGPQVKLFIDDKFFVDGGITSENPVLYAEIFDESGINVGTGIGHDITAILDHEGDRVFVLNDFFLGSLNDYQRGEVSYPLFGLSPGKHVAQVKVWDALNNSSVATVSFVVPGDDQVKLDKLRCYPNPFSSTTKLFFEHNQSGEVLLMDYMIFDLSGRLVFHKTVEERLNGSRSSSLTWNGTDNNGTPLSSGIYICKLLVSNKEGGSSVVNGKFILTR